MTADEFVAALAACAARYVPGHSLRADGDQAAAARAWATVPRRTGSPPAHPPDPLLDLLGRYDLSQVEIWQFRFSDGLPGDPWSEFRHVGTQCAYDYYVDPARAGGRMLVMYYKDYQPEYFPSLTSAQFLELLVLYAKRRVVLAPDATDDETAACNAAFAARAASISPDAPMLNWYGEQRRGR